VKLRSSFAAAVGTAVVVAGGVVAPAAQAAESEVLSVDFSARTGEFRGGATGTLYGFGDEGAPTQALIDGAHITNTSQKAPYGTQHPSGDALAVEDGFLAKHGEDMYIYVQDYYPDWSYNGGARPGDDRTYDQSDGTFTEEPNGVWDYLEIVEFVAQAVADDSSSPDNYVFIPFNEPDGGNWYADWGTMKDTFLDDWQASYDKIQEVWERNGLGHARVGGPGDSRWHSDRSRDYLAFAKEHESLPDVFIWHELGIDNLATYRGNFAAYRAMEEELGIDPLPVNITEYGMLRDMGVPGQLVQWLSMFEDTKVDAQTAYWNYAGNFSDNSARPNGANAGWWMFKWYGDLEGSETVEVAPPALNVADSLQGIAAIDDENQRATVLWGGGSRDVTLDLSSLPESFGDEVDVEVREIALTGAEGLANTPRVVEAISGAKVEGGALSVSVDIYDRYAGYQLIVTPSQGRDVEAAAAAQPWAETIEAEDTALTDAAVYEQDPLAGGGWKFLASHGKDVGSFNKATSRADWTVEVPDDGLYRLQVIGGAPGVPGRHALFVDDTASGTIQYTADLALNDRSRWQYRGSAEALVELSAGTHVVSVRASEDGENALPNSDITLDKLGLTSVGTGERTRYPASTFRVYGGARLDWAAGGAVLEDGGRVDVYATAMDTGYYDVDVEWDSDAPSAVSVSVNGTSPVELTADGEGAWRSTARLHLVEGINELEISSGNGSVVRSVGTTRVREADDAEVSIEAESASLSGTAEAIALPESSGTNASGAAYVGSVGDGAENAIEIARTSGIDAAGDYDVTVHYANAELSGDHDYNPQVVDRRIDVSEGGEGVGHAYFRYTYSWDSFWERTIPVTLTTADQPLRLGNESAHAPNIDRIVIAPRVLGEPVTEAADGGQTLTIELTATTRCVAGRVVVVATAVNTGDAGVVLDVASAFGEKSGTALAAGKTASYAFSSRASAVDAGTVSAAPAGADAVEASYAGRDCG